MPLVVLCGYPCSGKTQSANALREHIETVEGRRVFLVSDADCLPLSGENQTRNQVYNDSQLEKQIRGQLKSEVQRYVDADNVVILDSFNYIKGFRYELFCVVKALQTPHCVIFCDVPPETVQERNSNRPPDSAERYPVDLLEALMMRFEPPVGTNRWDSPLIRVGHDEVGGQEHLDPTIVCDALLRRKAPPPNQSTQSQPLSSTNFLQELDRMTQAAVLHLMREQNSCQPGGNIVFPGLIERGYLFRRRVTLAELQRSRRQFVLFIKSRPNEDLDQCRSLFIQYLNDTIT